MAISRTEKKCQLFAVENHTLAWGIFLLFGKVFWDAQEGLIFLASSISWLKYFYQIYFFIADKRERNIVVLKNETFFSDIILQSEDDCDELPPPPGHCEEPMTSPNGGQIGSRLVVSPRPTIQQKKNPMHEVQVSTFYLAFFLAKIRFQNLKLYFVAR